MRSFLLAVCAVFTVVACLPSQADASYCSRWLRPVRAVAHLVQRIHDRSAAKGIARHGRGGAVAAGRPAAPAAHVSAAPKYRYECQDGVCRRLLVP